MSTTQQVKKQRGRPRKVAPQAQPQPERNGQMTVQEAGRKGGTAVSQKYGKEFYEDIGQKGGTAVASKFGTDFFQAIGQKGGTIRGLRNEERELHDRLYEENKVPQEYLAIRNDMYVKTENFRMMASTYVDKLYQAVKGKLEPIEVKALVFWDATRIWTEGRIYQVFRAHNELSQLLDERKQAAGTLGGQATAEAIKEADQAIEESKEQAGVERSAETATAQQEEPEEMETPKSGNGKPQLVGTVIIDLGRLEGRLMTAIVASKANGSNKIELPFDTEGNAVDVRAVE